MSELLLIGLSCAIIGFICGWITNFNGIIKREQINDLKRLELREKELEILRKRNTTKLILKEGVKK
jgi:hypothetical protein